MAFKIKDGVRIGTTDVFNNSGTLLVPAPRVVNSLSSGSGLTGGPYDGSTAITIAHADTSNASNLTANGRTYVTGLTFDGFGHVTGYTTGTETVTDTNTTYSISTEAGADAYSEIIRLTSSTGVTDDVTLAVGAVDSVYGLTIEETGDTITLKHANTSSATNLTAASRTYVTALTFDTYGHVTGYSTGTETSTNNNDFGTFAIAADSGYTWGTANTNTDQVADAVGDKLTLVRGLTGSTAGIDLFTSTVAGTDAIKIAHADTSTLTGLQGGNGISSITVDEMGHITAVGTATYLTTQKTSKNIVGASSIADANAAATNGNVYINHLEDTTVTSAHKIIGAGATTVTSDASGNITITSTDTNTDTNTTYTLDGSGSTNSVNIELIAGGSGSGTDSINVVGSGATTVSWDETNQRITISSTDTNTDTDTLQSIAADTSNNDRFITTVANATGAQTGYSHSTLKYNPSTETLKVTNLIVSGTSTTINTETINLADNIIVFNSNATGAATENAGIEIERGDDANKTLLWDEGADKWTVGSETFVAGTVETGIVLLGGKVRTSIVTGTLSANTATAIDSWATGTYRSAVYQIQLAQGSKYQFGEVRVMHDSNGVAYVTEFAVLENSTIGTGTQPTFTASIVSGTLSLNILVDNAASTNVTYIIEKKLFAI